MKKISRKKKREEKPESNGEKIKAKKSLGQHFLTSQSALKQIVEAGNVTSGDIVVEIGPGNGVLTEALVGKAGKVIAIEKDNQLAGMLKEKFSRAIQGFSLELIAGDVLDFDPTTIKQSRKAVTYKVIANIPYYITNAISGFSLKLKRSPSKWFSLSKRKWLSELSLAMGRKVFSQ